MILLLNVHKRHRISSFIPVLGLMRGDLLASLREELVLLLLTSHIASLVVEDFSWKYLIGAIYWYLL